METNIIKWNFPNWATVLLMWAVGYAIMGVAWTYINQKVVS